MKIQCVDRDIRQILESGTYLIPRFQRPYSWDRDNVEEFWNDCTSDIRKDYFIGAFVTYAISSSEHGIVDGQQRLTTITIALCALRDKYSELGHDSSAKGVHRLIQTRDLDDREQFVLRAQSSYPYLQAKIQSFTKDDEAIDVGEEEKAIEIAYTTVRANLDHGVAQIAKRDPSKARAASKKWLDQVRDKLLSLKVISIALDSQDDAYTIFETLNTRGKDLTSADLAKNHFLRLLPEKGKAIDRPNDRWLEMQSELEQADRPIQLKTFLHHYWLSKYPFTTEKQLFKSIRDTVTSVNVKDVVNELRSDSVLYRGISEPDHLDIWGKPTSDVKDSLLCISQILNIQIANPLLLTALRLYKANRIKDGQIREIFGLVERYHYTYTTICALPSSGGVSQMYAVHARELANAKDSNEIGRQISDFKKKIKGKIPGRDVFISKFRQLSYSNARQRDVLRYTLWKLDRARNPAVDIDRSAASIEHLLPQSAGSQVAHSIGNLILIPAKFNGEVLGSKPFPEKKRLLQQGGYPLEKTMASAKSWGAAEIDARLNEMASFAYDVAWAIK